MNSREKIAKTIDALNQHGFEASYVPDRDECRRLLLALIPPSASVGVPGSATVRATGIVECLRERGQPVYDHWVAGMSKEEALETRRKQLLCDVLLCSANAVSATGEIVNMDGIGNRIAASAFGPGRVIIVAGRNKIAANLAAARRRIHRVAAPRRTRELKMKTPCARTGKCADCNVPDRICRAEIIMHRAPSLTPTAVLIVDEELGN
jgi:hypothetical protein